MSYDFNEYFRAIFDLFKDNRETLLESDEYQRWQDFDLPTNIEFDKVPDEWKNFIQDPEDIRDLIYCIETGLINIFEVVLYQFFRKIGSEPFKEDLLMTPLAEYQRLIGILHQHISTDSGIGSAFHWFSSIESNSIHRNFLLEHHKMISSLSSLEISKDNIDFFSNIYLHSFPLRVRKFLGEEYTPVDVVDFILDSVQYSPDNYLLDKKLLDPATGLGIFITRALKRLFESHNGNFESFLNLFLKNIPLTGAEFKLFSAKAAHLNFYVHFLHYASKLNGFNPNKKLPCIIHHGNALLFSNAVLSGFQKHLDVIGRKKYDFVIGNPPYLRIQNIKPDSLKDYYVQNYKSAEGRFDLSFLFIECGLDCLKPGGRLGYITTNKFMTVGAGRSLRNLIQTKSQIEKLIDLGDTEFFEAAVLPCIIILKKGGQKGKYTFPYAVVTKLKGKLKEKTAKQSDLFDFLHINSDKDVLQEDIIISNQKGQLPVNVKIARSLPPESNGDTWHFLTPKEHEIISAMINKANTTLKDISDKIMVGIKSTADDVFIKPMTEDFIRQRGLETELIHPLLRGKKIKKWKIDWSPNGKHDRFVLYPHEKINGKLKAVNLERYPETKHYLEEHYDKLNKRTYVIEAGRKWYEIWVAQDPDYFAKPFKILTPDFSTGNNFAIDRDGFYLGTSALAIILREQDEIFNYYILGLLNSTLMEFFHKFKSSTFIYAGRYRYWASYMEKYPIYLYRESKEDARFCERIAEISLDISREQAAKGVQEKELNQHVYDLFGITQSQAKHIEFLLS